MRVPLVQIPTRLRHHMGLVVALPLAISGILVLLVTAPSWQGWPTATNTFALMPFIFGAPLLAAVQAFESSRIEESAVAKTWVVRTPHVKMRENLRPLAGSWICVLFCAFTWFVAAHVMTSLNRQADAEASLRPIIGYVGLAFFSVAAGHLLGKLKAHLAVAVAVAFVLALVVSLYVTQYGNTSPAYLARLLPIVTLWGTGVAGTIAAILAPFGRMRGTIPTFLVAVLVACNLTAAAYGGGNVLRSDVDEVCSENTVPTICLWREHEAALAPLVEISRAVREVAPPAMDTPPRINEFGFNGDINVSTTLNLDNNFLQDRATLTIGYVRTLSNYTFVEHNNSNEGRAAQFALESLLVVAAYPEISDSDVSLGYLDRGSVERAREIVKGGAIATQEQAALLFAAATRDLR